LSHNSLKTHHIHIAGIVQGVGFRPFVFGLATRLQLFGWVCNTSAGVEIEVQGSVKALQEFEAALLREKPPLARLDSISTKEVNQQDIHTKFIIRESATIAGAFQPISADVAICHDCEHELFDPQDRRYLYPFINCTNCGPRFTIIKDIPYDRPSTTMAGFILCQDCDREYNNPLDRRFHAQPVACAKCGPDVWLMFNNRTERITGLSALLETRRLLHEGYIIAIKGLGGFHLACDASNPQAVEELRRRKGRVGKPFALMATDLATIEENCYLSDQEGLLLSGREKPIVLLRRRQGSSLPAAIAPGLDTIGMMLPYTPLHLLLLNQTDRLIGAESAPPLLIMTSGNISEEPIATENKDAIDRLAALADAFLLHDRDIQIRCDDSVVHTNKKTQSMDGSVDGIHCSSIAYLRRSRGYAPDPILLPTNTQPTLAAGSDLKNTFCLTRDKYAFLSHYIGDMENVETYASFAQGVEHLSRLFRITPVIMAYDMHPGFFTTQWVERNSADTQTVPVQHHHAHIAACMADNQFDNRKVIGLAFDGTGYGTDGTIWGGEFLVADYTGFERAFHLEYLPLPGGDAAIYKPWRVAVGYTHALGLDISDLPLMQTIDAQAVKVVRIQVERHLNTVNTSSMGRLFDAVAALLGIRTEVTYEAQAAMELEMLARKIQAKVTPYPYQLQDQTIVLKELIAAVIASIRKKESPEIIGARFHKTIAVFSVEAACHIRNKFGINEVALSGGVWQNQLLYEMTTEGLEMHGFRVYSHCQTPANDGGIALGQAVISNHVILADAAKSALSEGNDIKKAG
jgi:hydrogenase maturation protein HypF